MTKGQKIMKAMEDIRFEDIYKQPEPPASKQGSGDLATTLPRKKENPLQNTNNPPVA